MGRSKPPATTPHAASCHPGQPDPARSETRASMIRAGLSPAPLLVTYPLARQWSAGSSGGWGEACGYRWIIMQVRVRVTPSTTWMWETTSRPS